MRPSPRRVDLPSRREPGLRHAGIEGARALTRLLVALIENLGLQDGVGRRPEANWPHGRNFSAFGPSPLGVEIERAAMRMPAAPSGWQDSVTGLPIHEDVFDEPPPPTVPPPRPVPPVATRVNETQPTPQAVEVASPSVADIVPIWMRPFVPLPGVRYVRTPDHILRRRFAVEQPMPPIASESDLGDEAVPPEPDDLRGSPIEAPEALSESCDTNLEDAPAVDSSAARRTPQRLWLRKGASVALPDVANETMSPPVAPPPVVAAVRAETSVAEKSSFAVAVRAKPKPAGAEPAAKPARAGARAKAAAKPAWDFPSVELLGEAQKLEGAALTADTLEQNARLLETTLEDFGVRGEIIHVRAGPVVTLYELEPAPGMKSSRVIGLADDIARSMSALSARVAVVPGRNAIGIELPNERRETVFFREMVESEAFADTKLKLAIALGKTIGGEPVVAELAKMPHLLVAGTTGSGKSVAINTMILSLLYRLKPEQCRLIMVDPKMLELSVYDGIPHLLTPVVTDPKKAVVALKWAVREMEDRYRKMSKVGVRNIDGFNARVAQANEAGDTIMVPVTTGYDRETGKPVIEDQPLDLAPLPYIVVIVDEMADLMMVAGKDIEGAIQRLAQMARAAGIHLIMATQRPSVDVITGTIKANFPTRISFQVTSKIDSRTILGEMGAEQLLGQGDMLHMQGGGRIYRVHGPFVSDDEVERVVAHLKSQGAPNYLDAVTDEIDADTPAEDAEDADIAVFDKTATGADEDGDLYEQAVKIVLRDKKSSVSYVQRRLSVGYNKAASLIERMEKEGVLGPASHTGKREILAHGRGRIISGVATDADDP